VREAILRPTRAVLNVLGVRWLLLRTGMLLNPRDRPKVKQVQIMGIELLVLANEDVGRRIAFLKRYETRDAEFLVSTIRAGDICLDVGANTGYYTMLMGRAAAAGEVHAFEPVGINWHLLGGGVALNRLENVVTNNVALGAKPGETEFSQAIDGAYSSLLAVGRRPEHRQIKVIVDTIDAYSARCALPRIDVMKVDVEGAEALVIEGARRVLESDRRRPRVVMLELNSVNLAPYGSSIDQMVEKMAGFGYFPHIVDTTGRLSEYSAGHHDIFQNVFFFSDRNVSGQSRRGV
jgi:FkbM family methyltransferase